MVTPFVVAVAFRGIMIQPGDQMGTIMPPTRAVEGLVATLTARTRAGDLNALESITSTPQSVPPCAEGDGDSTVNHS